MFLKKNGSFIKPSKRGLPIVVGVASVLLLSLTMSPANAHNRDYYHEHREGNLGGDLIKGAIIGRLLGGKKGAKRGAIAGAIVGGIKRNERRKYREWKRRQWEEEHWNNGWD